LIFVGTNEHNANSITFCCAAQRLTKRLQRFDSHREPTSGRLNNKLLAGPDLAFRHDSDDNHFTRLFDGESVIHWHAKW
jgi:hypothetical protein